MLPHTHRMPKCLLDVGGESILAFQVRHFLEAGLQEVLVVTGFGAQQVRDALDGQPELRWVHNLDHATTNSLASLALAREALGGRSFLLCNGDVLFHPGILEGLLQAPGASALTLDREGGRGEEEMKVRVSDGRVSLISKEIPGEESDGENLGLLRFGARGGELLLEVARRLVEEGSQNQWAPYAYNQVILQEPIHVVEVGGLPWIEIDTPEDLELARREIHPRCIAGAAERGHGGRRS